MSKPKNHLHTQSQKLSFLSFRTLLAKYWQSILYILFGLFLRVWNFRNSLYFIYDQGRDALVLDKILHGDPVLVGPTSGLSGFFLGPLWYYVGLPGFILGEGNPYVICLWYIAISCIALPLFWYLAHRLFKEKIWAVVCALLLAMVPGSIEASIFIWNPLLSVPLMTGAVLSFWKARNSRVWLGIGFLLIALTLQSEFAYAVFFLPSLFLLIPWVRQKFDLRDFGMAIFAVGVTGIPQLLFEVRNRLIMTTSLLHSMNDKTQSVSWKELWAIRPIQLLSTTRLLLTGERYSLWTFNVFVLLLLFLAVLAFIQKYWATKKSSTHLQSFFLWQLVFIFACIPYPFFMLWRGNHGYFFSYYITAHFIFLVPLITLGIKEIAHLGQRIKERNHIPFATYPLIAAASLCVGFFTLASFQHLDGVVFRPENNAGLAKMVSATERIYEWHAQDFADQSSPWVVKTYTANVYTEQYDYLLGWYGRSHHVKPPQTVLDGKENIWYLIIQSRDQATPFFFIPWYETATKGGHRTRQEQIGVLTLETWKK